MKSRTRVLVSALIVLAGCAPSAAPEGGQTAKVRVDVGFRCLWWSPAQMEGMNPNTPPPKNTEVTLSKWEYTDPVGVPHPDVVDIVATLANDTAAASPPLEVEVAGEWKTGPMGSAARAVWGERSVLRTFQDVAVPAGGSQEIRVPVDLKQAMDRLEPQKRWPHALRITVTVRRPGSTQAVAERQAELPIRAGD